MNNSRCIIVDNNVKKKQQGKRENSWFTRNNSLNVSSLLHPDDDDDKNPDSELNTAIEDIPPRSIVVSNHCYKENKIPKFCCDDCYCQRSPVYPKLPLKLINEKFGKLKGPQCKKFHHICSCGCGFHSKRCRYGCYNKCCNSPFLRYSAHRDAYEKFLESRECEQYMFKDIPLQQNKVGNAENNRESKNAVCENINEIEQTEASSKDTAPNTILDLTDNEQVRGSCDDECCNKITILDSGLNTARDLKRLNTFRKENYFECHSSGNEDNAGQYNHKCIHKFILDNRFIPRPINADPYGTSRCVICNRSTKSEILNPDNKMCQKPRLSSSKRSKPHIDQTVPTQIHFCNKNDGIEITVPLYCNKYNNIFDNNIKIKNPPTTNSFALRYQKGVI